MKYKLGNHWHMVIEAFRMNDISYRGVYSESKSGLGNLTEGPAQETLSTQEMKTQRSTRYSPAFYLFVVFVCFLC